jgi:hypothetical protein
MSAKERRSAAIRRAAWVAGGVGAFAAGAALSDDDPEPQAAEMDPGFGEAGSGL